MKKMTKTSPRLVWISVFIISITAWPGLFGTPSPVLSDFNGDKRKREVAKQPTDDVPAQRSVQSSNKRIKRPVDAGTTSDSEDADSDDDSEDRSQAREQHLNVVRSIMALRSMPVHTSATSSFSSDSEESSSSSDDDSGTSSREIHREFVRNNFPIGGTRNQMRAFLSDAINNGVFEDGAALHLQRAGYQSVHLTEREPHSMADNRQLEMLRRLSTQLFYQAKTRYAEDRKASPDDNKEPGPVEVEAMYADGKLFLATNRREHLDRIKDALETSGGRRAALTTSFDNRDRRNENVDNLLTRITSDFEAMYNGSYDWSARQNMEEARGIFEALQGEDVNVGILDMDDRSRTRNYKYSDPYTDDQRNTRVYLVYGKNDDHAEQKLMRLVEAIGNTERQYYIAGKKRPCFACFADLHNLSDRYQVEHNEHPGKIWVGVLSNLSPDAQRGAVEYMVDTYITARLGSGFASESSGAFSSSDADDESSVSEADLHALYEAALMEDAGESFLHFIAAADYMQQSDLHDFISDFSVDETDHDVDDEDNDEREERRLEGFRQF